MLKQRPMSAGRDTGLRLDGFGVCVPGPEARYVEDDFRVSPSLGLALVSSGMGGIGGQGRPSAKLAIWSVVGHVEMSSPATPPLERMRAGLERADLAISRLFRGANFGPPPACFGGVLVDRSGACVVAHVGDARVYHLRGSTVLHVTHDHTLINEYRALGVEPDHTHAHVVTRALGFPQNGGPVLTKLDVEPGDRLLLCTRHIRDWLDDDALLELATRPILTNARERLDAQLREHGSRNRYRANTLVLVELSHATPSDGEQGGSQRPVRSWLYAPGEELPEPPGEWSQPDVAWFRDVYGLVMGEDG